MNDEEKKCRELIYELEDSRNRIYELEKIKAASQKAERRLLQLSKDLGERIKELNCLYGISRLRGDPNASFDGVLQGIVNLIPHAWTYPEIACARLILGDREIMTEIFRDTVWKQAVEIKAVGCEKGRLEVCYLEEKPTIYEGPFLSEERSLLEAIAKNIEEIIAHNHTERQNKLQQQQLIQLDKLAAMGTLVSGVAHEINNPNNFIMLNAPLLKDIFESTQPILDAYYEKNGDFLLGGLQFSEIREKVPLLFDGILEGAKRIKGIVESLKDFARIEVSDQKKQVDLNAITVSALKLIDNLVRKSTRYVSLEFGKNLPPIAGSFQRLEQVIVNLVQNACEALPNRDKAIFVSTRYASENHSVILTLKDEGVGIPADIIPRIIDPFFTTKRKIGGTGLGLSVSAGIVKDHGGTLRFESQHGKGTTAIVTLPCISKVELSRLP